MNNAILLYVHFFLLRWSIFEDPEQEAKVAKSHDGVTFRFYSLDRTVRAQSLTAKPKVVKKYERAALV